MPGKPPRCPDCASANAVPIVYGEPTEDLAREAEHGAVALGGCVLSGSDPAWACPECQRRFGDTAKPSLRLPERTRQEWTELIGTMMPKPCTINGAGEILGGNPVTVIVRVDKKAIRIMMAELVWEQTHVATLRSSPFSTAPLKAPAVRVAELINAASTKRLSQYRWCPRCHAMNEPERMMQALCHGCAERVQGIMF